MPIEFDTAVQIAKEFSEQLPDTVAADLEDVEVMVCANRERAVARLNEVVQGDPLELDEIPANAKGIFIGSPATREPSDESEEEEVIELASGFVVLLVDQIDDVDACKLVLLHEFGHALGLDEEEIADMGLGVGEGDKNDNQAQPVQPAATPAI